MPEFVVKVYQYKGDLAAVPVGEIFKYFKEDWTGRAKDLVFNTKNPGGYADCSFRVNLPFERAVDVYSTYHHDWVCVQSGAADDLWQGRIEDITAEPGQVEIVARGYWSNAFDTIYDDGSFIVQPSAENGLNNLTGYAAIAGNYQIYAQSFQLPTARAIKDIQIRLANFGIQEGELTVELCDDNSGEPGTVIASRIFQVSSLENAGFSEFTGITSDYKLSASTTYWIQIRADGDYYGSVVSVTGTDNGGDTGNTYLIDTTKDFTTLGVVIGTYVQNTTDSLDGAVIDIDLEGITVPAKRVWYRYGDPDTWEEKPNLKDGNVGTGYNFVSWDYENDWIMVGHSAKFGGLDISLGVNLQENPAGFKAQYADGDGWAELEIVEDGTSVNGVTFAQSGNIRWKIPDVWILDDVGPSGDREEGYWIRFGFTNAVSGIFTITETDVGKNSKLTFDSLNFDNGDGYSIAVSAGVGIDTGAHYASGKLRYKTGATWYDYSPSADAIFYVWTHPKFYYSTGTTTSSADVISDALQDCVFVRDTNAFFLDDGRSQVNPIMFSSGEKPGDVIQKIIAFGSSGSVPSPLFFGIYEEAYPHLRKMEDGNRWYVDVNNMPYGQQAMAITTSLLTMFTRTAVLFSDTVGSRELTTWQTNEDLYARFGYNRDGVFSIAGASEVVADIIADVVAKTYDKPEQRLDILVDGYVQDGIGRYQPAWVVRAGDIVKLQNVIPTSSTLSSDIVDNISTIYVQETSYDAETGRLRITPVEFTRALLDIILSMAGLSGGSMV